MKVLLTKKVGMTSILDNTGAMVPVTILSAGSCVVTKVLNQEKDGYTGVALGIGKDKHPTKPLVGSLKELSTIPKIIREFRGTETDPYTVGDAISADVFNVGDLVSVVSTSKGKGFAGTIKRHNFKRGPRSHGGMNYRKPGSIGSQYPQKVFKGKRMAGHDGHSRTTVHNLKVVMVDMEHNVIAVRGAVPGPKKSLVMVKGAK
jgi:large subunit ribosomal protein L3